GGWIDHTSHRAPEATGNPSAIGYRNRLRPRPGTLPRKSNGPRGGRLQDEEVGGLDEHAGHRADGGDYDVNPFGRGRYAPMSQLVEVLSADRFDAFFRSNPLGFADDVQRPE